MSFFEEIERTDFRHLRERVYGYGPADVERALSGGALFEPDIEALFSPAADPYLEELASRSAALTSRRFGRVIQLYAPVYLSNECVNRCTYCGFSHELDITRLTLSPSEVAKEASVVRDCGFGHVLLVSGDDPRRVSIEYLEETTTALSDMFDSISVEIEPMSANGYERLVRAGVDGLALYQEVYDPGLYGKYHLAGPKRRYRERLQAVEDAGEAGFRAIGIGALLGLADWRTEAVMTAMHARWLTRRFWRSRIGVSFPRIQESAHGFTPPYPVGDRDVVHMICAMRLILPDAELVLSTREGPRLRDSLVGLGITRMSAGSRTDPGGYAGGSAGGRQFEIVDGRSPQDVASMIRERGFDPVWKDFDREFVRGGFG